MRKLTATFTILFTAITSIYALPGFKPAIQDLPGQYVYYQDKTFERESYCGFMIFDEKSYAARYYAPVEEKTKSPEIDVEIYVTIDPKSNHLELTGEKIVSGFSQEEAEYINYLHDMLYELSARRIKTPEASQNDEYRKNDFYPQFGGSVTFTYSKYIPLFNVKDIFQEEGKPDFEVVTCGQISSSDDKSFENFKGFPSKFEDNRHKLSKSKKAKKTEINSSDNIKFQIDSDWKTAMENVWVLNDAALVSTNTIPDAPADFLTRQLLLSAGTNYLYWKDFTVTNKENQVKIECIFYDPETKNISRNFKLAKKQEGGYKFFTLTVYNNIYNKNRRYFNEIINSVD